MHLISWSETSVYVQLPSANAIVSSTDVIRWVRYWLYNILQKLGNTAQKVYDKVSGICFAQTILSMKLTKQWPFLFKINFNNTWVQQPSMTIITSLQHTQYVSSVSFYSSGKQWVWFSFYINNQKFKPLVYWASNSRAKWNHLKTCEIPFMNQTAQFENTKQLSGIPGPVYEHVVWRFQSPV